MKKLTLIYFAGCPNIEPAKVAIREAGFDFEEFDQDNLPDGHKFKDYSSPTILDGDKILYGSEVSGGGCSVAKLDAEEIKKVIQSDTKSDSKLYKMTLAGGLFSSLLAATCCVGPLVFALIGVGGAGFSAALSDYSWWFIGAAFLFFSISVIQMVRLERKNCVGGTFCGDPKKRKIRRITVLTSLLIGGVLAASPFVLEIKANNANASASQGKIIKTYFVEGMTCGGCELGVREALKKSGVKEENILSVDHSQPDPKNKIGMATVQFEKASYRGSETDCKIVEEIKKSPGYIAFWDMSDRNPCGKTQAKFDSTMSKVCQMACAAKTDYKESDLVANSKAKAGDLTRCPVSGVVFEVKKENPVVSHLGKRYVVCCNGCKAKFEANPFRFSENLFGATNRRVR